MTLRTLIISNPAAGRQHSSLVQQVMARLEADDTVVTHITTRCADELEQIVSNASRTDWDRIAIAGGDGSLMAAINGCSDNTPPIGLIPTGTANVVSLELGLPTRPAELADIIVQGNSKTISVPEANGRRFVFSAGAGLDAYLVATVSRTLKKHLGKTAFAVAAGRAIGNYRFPKLDIIVDGAAYSGVGVIIMNGSFYAGRYKVAPARDLSDPAFSVIVLSNPGWRSAIGYIAAMVRGKLHSHSGIKFIQSANSVDVAGCEEVAFQTDGDHAEFRTLSARANTGNVKLIAP